ncbi:MAG: nucleotidyltransferase domain-containing protein [Aquisalinus sp.]|nr:nucleotidyltransferase domain-containing protein [Aquisalinus sp.]
MSSTFDQHIEPEVHKHIMAELASIEHSHDVRILFAVESGSRAWGFPSPDSDYDVRFVYARPVDWYLTIEPGRDVIELPIEGDMDINGWDVKKALGLLIKPNPVLLEWLSSPVRYLWNSDDCELLKSFSEKVTHGPACLNHYLSLGSRQWNVYVEGKAQVNLKKYFYIVRPAMAIRWLRMNPDQIPPMNFSSLKEGINLNADLTAMLDRMLEQKSRSKELGEAPRIDLVDQFIEQEFQWAKESVKTIKTDKPDLKLEADKLFRRIVQYD